MKSNNSSGGSSGGANDGLEFFGGRFNGSCRCWAPTVKSIKRFVTLSDFSSISRRLDGKQMAKAGRRGEGTDTRPIPIIIKVTGKTNNRVIVVDELS